MATKAQDLLESLFKAHEVYYDVTRDYEFAGRRFPGYAEFHTHGEKFVLSKKAKLWEVDAHEFLFFDYVASLSRAYLDEAASFIIREAMAKVKPEPDHMTSYLSLVIVADSVDEDVPKRVRSLRFRKNFRLGLRGWADLRLAVIDLSYDNVYTNGQGKEIKGTLLANLKKVSALDATDGEDAGVKS